VEAEATNPVVAAAISGGAGLVGALVGGWLSRRATLEGERERQRFARQEAEQDYAARLRASARLVLDDLVAYEAALRIIPKAGWYPALNVDPRHWEEHASELARGLAPVEWRTVGRAFSARAILTATLTAMVGSRLHLPTSELEATARGLIQKTIEQSEEARGVLQSHAGADLTPRPT
jgi:hypothetical protein